MAIRCSRATVSALRVGELRAEALNLFSSLGQFGAVGLQLFDVARVLLELSIELLDPSYRLGRSDLPFARRRLDGLNLLFQQVIAAYGHETEKADEPPNEALHIKG